MQDGCHNGVSMVMTQQSDSAPVCPFISLYSLHLQSCCSIVMMRRLLQIVGRTKRSSWIAPSMVEWQSTNVCPRDMTICHVRTMFLVWWMHGVLGEKDVSEKSPISTRLRSLVQLITEATWRLATSVSQVAMITEHDLPWNLYLKALTNVLYINFLHSDSQQE